MGIVASRNYIEMLSTQWDCTLSALYSGLDLACSMLRLCGTMSDRAVKALFSLAMRERNTMVTRQLVHIQHYITLGAN